MQYLIEVRNQVINVVNLSKKILKPQILDKNCFLAFNITKTF